MRPGHAARDRGRVRVVDAALAQRLDLRPSPPEQEGVAPLQPHDRPVLPRLGRRLGRLPDQRVDVGLGPARSVVAALPDAYRPAVAGDHLRDRVGRKAEVVVEDDVRLAEQPQGLQWQVGEARVETCVVRKEKLNQHHTPIRSEKIISDICNPPTCPNQVNDRRLDPCPF